MNPRRIVIVGGGITGLTAAFRLLSLGRDALGAPFSVTLLEASPRLGGNIVTKRHEGYVLDGGPDAFVTMRPHAIDLCKELGLGDRLVGTKEENRKVYVRRGGVLHPLPEGVVLGVPTRVLPLVTSPLFTWRGKARMGLDLAQATRSEAGDESIAAFIERRLGREALDRLAEPLLGGIYAGDVDELSIAATFPQLVEMERTHGSLIRGMLARRAASRLRAGDRAPPSVFQALRGGMGELADALVDAIEAAGGTIRVGARAEAIRAGYGCARFAVKVAGDAALVPAHDVVLCSPAHAAAGALDGFDGELAAILREIPYVSSATIHIGYARDDVPHALDASGLVVAKGEGLRSLAATFVSSKWAGRAPPDVALFRVFAGGHRDPEVLSQSDADLVAMAQRELEAILGIHAEPRLARVFRHPDSNPQPTLGHGARVQRARAAAAKHPGLELAGSAFDGVGISDCIRQANEVATRIAASFLRVEGPRARAFAH